MKHSVEFPGFGKAIHCKIGAPVPGCATLPVQNLTKLTVEGLEISKNFTEHPVHGCPNTNIHICKPDQGTSL